MWGKPSSRCWVLLSVSLRFSPVHVFHHELYWHRGPRADYKCTHVPTRGEGCGQVGPGCQAQSGWGEGPVDLEDTCPTFAPARGWCAGPEPWPMCLPKSLWDLLPLPRPHKTGTPLPVLMLPTAASK